jgi:hypothetical protein
MARVRRDNCDVCRAVKSLSALVRCSYEALEESDRVFHYGLLCFSCARGLPPMLVTEEERYYLFCRTP